MRQLDSIDASDVHVQSDDAMFIKYPSIRIYICIRIYIYSGLNARP